MSDHAVMRLLGIVAVALVLTIGSGAVLGSRAVAGDLRGTAQDVVAQAGLRSVSVDFSGREATVRGTNTAELARARSLVADVAGVRRVELVPERTAGRPGAARFGLDRLGDDVRIAGVVPSADDAVAIKVAVAEAFGTTVSGDVRVDRSIDGGDWIERLPALFAQVRGVEGLEIDIVGDGTVRLAGGVVRGRDVARIRARVADVLDGLEVESGLVVAASSRKAG